MDNLLTNKYICIALVVALLVVLYLYTQKKSCDVEGMQNLNLDELSPELTDMAWTNRPGGDNNRKYNNAFDRFADAYTKKKLTAEGYKYTKFLPRDDQRFDEYMRESYNDVDDSEIDDSKIDEVDDYDTPYVDQYSKKANVYGSVIPKPLDDRPDLGNCAPCDCKALTGKAHSGLNQSEALALTGKAHPGLNQSEALALTGKLNKGRPNARYSRKLLQYEPTSDEENDEEILREQARIKMAKAKMMKAKKGKKN